MGFLDMFDNPDIMNSILGINAGGAMGAPQAGAGAPPAPPPQMSGGMMGEVLDAAPQTTGGPAGGAAGPGGPNIPLGSPVAAAPMETNTGLFKHDQLPPGQPAGPTMAGAGFPPPPPGSAMAMPAAPGTASTTVPPSGVGYGGGPNPNFPGAPSGVGYGGGPIPTAVGPITPPGGPLDGRPAMPPPPRAYDGRPPTSTDGSLEAALGLTPRQRLGNAITAGMAGLGRGLTQVGQLHPGASGAAAFAAGAGGALEGGVHQLDLQQHQAHQQKMDNWLMTSGAFKDWVAARHADNEERSTDARALYYKSLANGTAGGGRGALRTPEQKVAFVENEALRMHDQYRKSAEKTAAALGKDIDDALVEKRTEEYRQRLYKHFNIDPNEAEKLGSLGIDETNPFPKGMTTDEFHERVPMGAFYDTGQKFDKDGNYKYARSDGSVGVHRGRPGARVILQRTAPPPELNGGVTPPSKLPLAEQESLLADEGQAPA